MMWVFIYNKYFIINLVTLTQYYKSAFHKLRALIGLVIVISNFGLLRLRANFKPQNCINIKKRCYIKIYK